MPNPFSFNPGLTPAENIDAFFAWLRAQDAEFTDLLAGALQELLPLPHSQPERQAMRQSANAAILRALSLVSQDAVE